MCLLCADHVIIIVSVDNVHRKFCWPMCVQEVRDPYGSGEDVYTFP